MDKTEKLIAKIETMMGSRTATVSGIRTKLPMIEKRLTTTTSDNVRDKFSMIRADMLSYIQEVECQRHFLTKVIEDVRNGNESSEIILRTALKDYKTSAEESRYITILGWY